MGVLVWILIKIPLLLIALIAGLYLLYLKNMYDVVDAECISCDKNDETKEYRLMYRYMTIHGNVIEQNEKPIDANSPRDIGEHYRLLVNKKFPTLIKAYDKFVYGTWSIILIAAILVLSL